MEIAPASNEPLWVGGGGGGRARSMTGPARLVSYESKVIRTNLLMQKEVRKRKGTIYEGGHPEGPPPMTFVRGSCKMLAANKLYWLLLCVPPALASDQLGLPLGASFTLCCVAILPLAGLLGDATEQVALHTNVQIIPCAASSPPSTMEPPCNHHVTTM